MREHPASLYTANPHTILLDIWLTLVCRREPKEQIISRELWDSWSVWLRVKTAVIVRRLAGLQGLVLGRLIGAPKRLQLWRDATEFPPQHATASHPWQSMNKIEKRSKDSIKNHSQLRALIIFLQPGLNGYHNNNYVHFHHCQ